MKQTELKRYTPLKARKHLKPVSNKTHLRNVKWRDICISRAMLLSDKYGYIICEYSGEPIRLLNPSADSVEDAWGHHIDRNRNNCTPENCYIVKYKYHSLIHLNHLRVKQLGFEGRNGNR